MNNSILKNLLMALPIFEQLNEEELDLLADIGTRQSHMPKEYLYIAGGESDGAILMSAGRVVIHYENDDERDTWARRGSLINELSLFSDKTYDYSIVAMEIITTYYFDREEFIELLRDVPTIGLKIQANIAKRLGAMGANMAN